MSTDKSEVPEWYKVRARKITQLEKILEDQQEVLNIGGFSLYYSKVMEEPDGEEGFCVEGCGPFMIFHENLLAALDYIFDKLLDDGMSF